MGDAQTSTGPNIWVEESLAAIDGIADGAEKVQALLDLASELLPSPAKVLERALAAADTIQNNSSKAFALMEIAPRLPESEQRAVLERALAAADSLQNDYTKVQALMEIAPRLPESEQRAVLERALAVADTIQDDNNKAYALSAIAPQLPESDKDLLERALAAADNLQDDYAKAQALSAIAPCLPESEQRAVLERALVAADSLQDDYVKAQALSAIAPRLPESEQRAVLERALVAADNLQDDYAKAQALSAIAPRLPETNPDLLERALAAADNILRYDAKAYALSAIAPRLPESEQKAVLERALDAADNLQDDYSKAYALSAIAPYLPETEQKAVLGRALAAADNLQYDQSKAEALSAIAQRLPETNPDLLGWALTAADNILRYDAKAYALSAIAPRLPESEQKAVLERALAAADNIQDDQSKAEALSAIAPQLPDAEILVQQFSGDRFSLVLNLVKAQATDAQKVQLLSAAAPHLSLGLLPAALQIIAQGAISNEALRVEALGNLAPYLATEQFSMALALCQTASESPGSAITRTFIHQANRAAALTHLLPYLASLDQYEAARGLIETAIPKPTYRAPVLTALATALSTERVADIVAKTPKLLKIAKDDQPTTAEERFTALVNAVWDMLQALPGDEYLGRRATILCQLIPAMSIAQIDNEVLPNLPSLFQYRAENTEHGYLEDSGYIAQVLTAIASHRLAIDPAIGTDVFQNPNVDAIVDSTKLIPNDVYGQVMVLSRLAGNRAINRAETIKSPFKQAAAWVEIACHTSDHQYKALQLINRLPNAYLQSQYLQRLIPHLHPTQSLEAARVIKEINRDYQRTQSLILLACKFPQFRPDAKAAALSLKNPVQQIEQLSVLAVEVPELLPDIIDLLEKSQPSPQTETAPNPESDGSGSALEAKLAPNALAKPDTETEEALAGNSEGGSETASQPRDLWRQTVQRKNLLQVLAPHLPMRINREVNRKGSIDSSNDLWARALYLLARSYRDALHGGSLRNESTEGKDALNLKDEIDALSNLLLMRDLEPPMTVGILGGWGGGKSYIMHLMQQRMTQIRSRPVNLATEAWHPDPNHEKLSPYVGHIYQIKFDAWTFAKSNLWASLMQTIFTGLDRQISLEQRLQKCFAEKEIDPYAPNSPYSDIWKVLYQANDTDREHFLQQVFKGDTLAELSTEQQYRVDKLLWDKRKTLKQEAIEKQQDIETELTQVKETISRQEVELKKAQQALENAQDPDKQDLIDHVNQILVVSGALLKSRLGEETFNEIQQGIESKLPSDLTPESFRRFQIEVRQFMTNILEGTDTDGNPFNFSGKVLKQWARRNLSFIIIFCLFALTALIAPWFVAWKLPDAIVPQIVAFITPLLPAVAMAQKLWRAGQQWYNQTKQALLDCEAEIQGSQAVIQRETRRFQINQEHRIQTLKDQIEQLKQQEQNLDQKMQTVQGEIPANVYASLGEFIAQRIHEGQYDRHLGLMHFVKEDLSKLSDRLLPPKMGSEEFAHKLEDLQQVFPRGPARVVVYIDDLDRCPPRRVVQVLEAVQLLVKTPLFIAVLAIDERYITRALEQFYKGVLLRHGSPSGTDYLEKIIQLPYRVRPIMASALEEYLRSQVVIQDNATGGSKFSEFSRQEFNLLLECCKQVDLSPRSLKRLTNVYKLFKIVCRTRGTKVSSQVQQAILALLALSGRYPDLMRGVFDDIETCYEEQRDKTEADRQGKHLHLESHLRDFFRDYSLPESDQYLEREFEKLQHDALYTNILPPNLTLQDMKHEIFNLIRSFSFVGDIGEDPDDYRQSGLIDNGLPHSNRKIPAADP